MRLHKVLLPAINHSYGRPVLSYGKIGDKYYFTYGSENHLIIVDKVFDHHQDLKLSESQSDYIKCVKMSEFYGYILAGYEKNVLILTPNRDFSESLLSEEFPCWTVSCKLDFEDFISSVNWNFLCTKFIVSTGNFLEIYRSYTKNESYPFKCIKICTLDNFSPAHLIEFTTDGLFFATSNFNENCVKVWYSMERVWNSIREIKQLSEFFCDEVLRICKFHKYLFVYLPHPRPVISFSWRRKCLFSNFDLISNVLLTSCQDGVGRIWSENLFDMKIQSVIGVSSYEDIAELPLDHELHLNNSILKRVWPYITFHVIIIINDSHIVLERNANSNHSSKFYWLNNKEIEVMSYCQSIFGIDFIQNQLNVGSKIDESRFLLGHDWSRPQIEMLNRALLQWHTGSDIIFAISTMNGSLLTWSIENLDLVAKSQTQTPNYYFLNSITTAFPINLAKTLNDSFVLHNSEVVSNLAAMTRHLKTDSNISSSNSTRTSITSLQEHQSKINSYPDIILAQSSYMYTSHTDRSFNVWKINYNDQKSFSTMHNVSFAFGIYGASFEIQEIIPHPNLPLIALLAQQSDCTKKVSEKLSAEILIWRVIPIISLISSKDTWSLQGTIKLKKHQNQIGYIWIPSINPPFNEELSFILSTDQGLGVFQIYTSANETYLSEISVDVPEIDSILTGIIYLGNIQKSNIKFSFLCIEKLCFNMAQTFIDIFIVFAVEKMDDKKCNICVWEISLQRGPNSPINSLRDCDNINICRDNQNSIFLSSLLAKKTLDFDVYIPIRWYSLRNTTFYNPYECNQSICIAAKTQSEDIIFVEIAILNEKHDKSTNFTKIYSNYDFYISFNFPYIFYEGLKTVINENAKLEKIITFSFCSPIMMASIGFPNDIKQTNNSKTNKMFVLRIFCNRLAGVYSWKQEACMLLPFSDFNSNDINASTLVEMGKNANISWCSLDNGEHLLGVFILGKILIFLSCQKKSIDDQPTDKSFYQSKNSSLWFLFSTIDLINIFDCKTVSTGFMGSTYFISHDKVVFCYVFEDSIQDLHQENYFEMNKKSKYSELNEGLIQSESLHLLTYLSLHSMFLIDQKAIIIYIFMDLYKYLQKNIIKDNFTDFLSSSNQEKESDLFFPFQKLKVKYKPPKIFQIVKNSFSIEKVEKIDHNEFKILETTLDQYLKDSEPESIIFDDRIVTELYIFFRNIYIEGIDSNDLKYIPNLAKSILEMNNLFKENKIYDKYTLIYFQAAKMYEFLSEEYLNSFHYLCSFHSRFKRELLDSLGLINGHNLTWEKSQLYGLGWWCRDYEIRKLIVDCIAKSEFQKKHEVLDSAVFYLILQKKSVIPALFKSQQNVKMYEFFSQNFSEEKAKLAALKNAFHLLTIHRYIHSISFFILAEKYSEAIQVSINNLNDLQLGFLIAVSYSSDSQNIFKWFIQKYLLGEDDLPKYPDLFLRSIGYFLLDRYIEGLTTLLDKNQSISIGLSVHPVIQRLQVLLLFRNLKSHESIQEYFTQIIRKNKDFILHNGYRVTRDYINQCLDRLICSCMKFTLNHGLPCISNLLSIHHLESTRNQNINHPWDISLNLTAKIDNFNSKASLNSSLCDFDFEKNNLNILSKSYLFTSFIKCIIDDIKNEERLIDIESFTHQIKYIEFFCINNMRNTNIVESLNNLTSHNLKCGSNYLFLHKYSYFISLLIRHFSLYRYLYFEILNDLLILKSDLESYVINNLYNLNKPIFPSLILTLNSSISFLNIRSFLNKLSSSILIEVFKIKHEVFFVDEKSNHIKENAFFINIYKYSVYVSKILFRALGGDLDNNYFSTLALENKKLYIFHKNRWETFSGNNQLFFDEIETKELLSLWSYSQDSFQFEYGAILTVYEAYLSFYTCLLMYALFNRDAKLCTILINMNDTLLKKWAIVFGCVCRVSLIPFHFDFTENCNADDDEVENDIFELTKSESSSDQNKSFKIFISPSKPLHDILKNIPEKEDRELDIIFDQEFNQKINYAWSIMISSILSKKINSIRNFLSQINITSSRIFSYSPIIHSILDFYNKIRCGILSKLDADGNPPRDFLPFSFKISTLNDSKRISDLIKQFSSSKNSPFQSIYLNNEAELWNILANDENLNNDMLLFSYPISPIIESSNSNSDMLYSIIYTEPSGIYQFCYDLNNSPQIAIAIANNIVELKISYGSISSIVECESNNFQSNQAALSLFLEDIKFLPHRYSNYYDKSTDISGNYSYFSPVMIKPTITRRVKDTYLLESHRSEPYYISAVRELDIFLYQYGVDGHLHQFEPAGYENSKLVHLLFNDQGNKFGTMDEDGYLSVFLFNTTSNMKPYFRQRCHNKFGTGFCFLGTSSLIAASGHSSDGIDVSLWDTLMPQRNRLTRSFLSHEHGCTTVAYSANTQSLVIGGRRGGLSIYDLRRQKMLTSIPLAHDSGISCLAIDKNFVATGSYDGVVKLWNISNNNNSYLDLSKSFAPFPINGQKSKDSSVRCIRMQGKYLFCSLQGCLSIRLLENESL